MTTSGPTPLISPSVMPILGLSDLECWFMIIYIDGYNFTEFVGFKNFVEYFRD